MFKHLIAFLCVVSSLSASISLKEVVHNCPQEHLGALQEFIQAFHIEENTSFEPLTGGLSRANLYTFSKDGQKFVLRFFPTGHTQEVCMGEIDALKIASVLGFSPQVLFFDSRSQLIVMPYIEGQPLYHPNDDQLKQMGKILHSLHTYQGPFTTKYPFYTRMKKHLLKGEAASVAYPTGFQTQAWEIINAPRICSCVPSHGDLNPSNILAGEKQLWLLDWANATWDDPWSDLSYYCAISCLSMEQEKILLTAYLGYTPTCAQLKALQNHKAHVYLLTALIWFRFSETDEEKKQPLNQRISQLDQALHSPDLTPYHEYLGRPVDPKTAPKSEIKSFALSAYKAFLDTK